MMIYIISSYITRELVDFKEISEYDYKKSLEAGYGCPSGPPESHEGQASCKPES